MKKTIEKAAKELRKRESGVVKGTGKGISIEEKAAQIEKEIERRNKEIERKMRW